MKPVLLFGIVASLLASISPGLANPEIAQTVARTFGQPTADGILLLRGSSAIGDPIGWTVYARDAFRQQDLVRIEVKSEAGAWTAIPAGAGNVLNPVPTRKIDFTRLRYSSADARVAAGKAAVLAQTTFSTINYQLAADATTGAPDWGLALLDDTGYEIGFCVVSGETGAVTFQDWTPKYTETRTGLFGSKREPESEGERAAKSVKRTARKAWHWTDNARHETRNFFRELFR